MHLQLTNYPDLGGFGYTVLPTLNTKYILKIPKKRKLKVYYYNENIDVSNIFIVPGMNFNNIKNMVQKNP